MAYIADTFHLTPKKKVWIISQVDTSLTQTWIADGPYDGNDKSFLFDDGCWYNPKDDIAISFIMAHAYYPNVATAQQFAEDHDCTIAEIVIV